jgi:hypothetical protein
MFGSNCIAASSRRLLNLPALVHQAKKGKSTVKSRLVRILWRLGLVALGAIFAGGCIQSCHSPDIRGLPSADERANAPTAQNTNDVPANRAPVIESLTAEPPVVNQAETTVIKCVAFDPDGDELAYQWVAARGNISGQGATVTWTAPSACDDYVVRVNVTDRRGGKTSRELGIKVKEAG